MVAYEVSVQRGNYITVCGTRLIAAVRSRFAGLLSEMDGNDGYSADFGDRRLNLRNSSTEPLVQLNIESRAATVSSKIG